ncbi:MAG: flagellar biosynthesis anti-sigma factor FlgM [Desulfatirhabdiaceae bacterium]
MREEKVASIKLRIQSGAYAINPDIIADNMISEAFLNEGLSP